MNRFNLPEHRWSRPRLDPSRVSVVHITCKWLALAGIASVTLGGAPAALATDYSWINPGGGAFTSGSNWLPFNPFTGLVGPGGAGDTVNFSLGTSPLTRYVVTDVFSSALAAGLFFDIDYDSNNTNTVALVVAGVLGDFNFDGTVDAADYVTWRKNDGTQDGYNAWRTNFGQTAGSGSVASNSVPVPTTLMIGLAAGMIYVRRWTRVWTLR